MQTLSSRTRTVLVALLVVLSTTLVVPAASGATTDTYAQQGADDEPNDDVENATRVDTDRAINGEIDGEGDVDYYAIDLREGSQVEITQGIGAGALPVTLLDRDGEVLGQIADQDSFEGEEDLIRANASYTGTYYLRVEGAPGEEYSISVSATEPDANEPNDDVASATGIESGERVVGTVVTGDRDVFAIDADAGEEIAVIGNATAAAAVTIYGPDESVLASEVLPSPGGVFESEQGYGTPVVTAAAAESGTYYVAVAIEENTIGNVNGPYNLTVTTSGDDESASAAEGGTTTDADDETTTANAATDEDETETETTGSESDGATTDDGTDGGDAATNAPATTSTEAAVDETTTDGTPTDGNDATTASVPSTTTAGTEVATDKAATGTVTASGDQRDVSEDVEATAVNGPGFGLLAALLALLGAALLATRRN